MRLELFIARRINGKQKMPPSVRLAVAGIALAVAVMIIALAILLGFKQEVRNKVIGFGAHIQITRLDSNTSYETAPVVVSDSLLATFAEQPDVRHVSVFSTKPGILKTDSEFLGIVLKGVDRRYDWTFFRNNLKEGDVLTLRPDSLASSALISRYQADLLGLRVGDNFLAYFVSDVVRARRFTVAGIYETGFGDYDKLFVLTDIRHIRRLNGWNDNEASGVEVQVSDYDCLDAVVDTLVSSPAFPPDLYVRSIKDAEPMIFAWLDVLDLNVAVILILMFAVAAVTMISGLLVIILERVHTIGLLKALGLPNTGIRKVFLCLAAFLIGKGMLWGNIIGLALCTLQARLHFLRLNPDTYYLHAVPIALSPATLIALDVATPAAILLCLLAPSHIIARIHPAKTLRFE